MRYSSIYNDGVIDDIGVGAKVINVVDSDLLLGKNSMLRGRNIVSSGAL